MDDSAGRPASGPPRPHSSTTTEVFDDGELAVVVFDARINRAYRLNPSASAVWLLCDGAATTDELADELAATFAVEHHEARQGVSEAITHFTSLGLLQGTEEAPPGPTREVASQILDRLPDP